MNLGHLSFSRVGNHRRVPHVPDNAERMSAYRAATPAQFGNASFTYPSPATGLLGAAARLTGRQHPFNPRPPADRLLPP